MRTATALLACAASASASYCELVKAHVKPKLNRVGMDTDKVPKMFMDPYCPSFPAGAPAMPQDACAVKANGNRPQHATNCAETCGRLGAECVDSSDGDEGKDCPTWEANSGGGCSEDAVKQKVLICVCREWEGVTPSPTSSTPSPSSSTPAPTSTTPAPTSSTPAPTAPTTPPPTSSTPSPSASTPAPTSTTPSPSSSTPSPTSTTPSPSSSTPSPTSTTPSPSSSTPSPTSTTPSPSSSTPSPTSTTPSPTSSTPAPTQESVSGDPFTEYAGKRTQFYLPPMQYHQLLARHNFEIFGRARNSAVVGDDQQWFDTFQLHIDGKEVLSVGVRNATALLPSGQAAVPDDDDGETGAGSDVKVADKAVSAALQVLRSAMASAARPAARNLTTLAIMSPDGAVTTTGARPVGDGAMNISVGRDDAKRIGAGYAEFVDIRVAELGIRMESSAAGKFSNIIDRVKNMHVDMTFTQLGDTAALTGVLPEIWGMRPMTTGTSMLLHPPMRQKADTAM